MIDLSGSIFPLNSLKNPNIRYNYNCTILGVRSKSETSVRQISSSPHLSVICLPNARVNNSLISQTRGQLQDTCFTFGPVWKYQEHPRPKFKPCGVAKLNANCHGGGPVVRSTVFFLSSGRTVFFLSHSFLLFSFSVPLLLLLYYLTFYYNYYY